DALRPQINDLLKSFLPDPLGIKGMLNTAAMIPKFHPPKDANLELMAIAGGYVSAKGGGLNLGVMTGANSDIDITTRGPGLASEPSLCVPQRPLPDYGSPPWMLPFNPTRKDFLLTPAGEFSGNPDPMDTMGGLQDLAIGISKTFLDSVGFHIYN